MNRAGAAIGTSQSPPAHIDGPGSFDGPGAIGVRSRRRSGV